MSQDFGRCSDSQTLGSCDHRLWSLFGTRYQTILWCVTLKHYHLCTGRIRPRTTEFLCAIDLPEGLDSHARSGPSHDYIWAIRPGMLVSFILKELKKGRWFALFQFTFLVSPFWTSMCGKHWWDPLLQYQNWLLVVGYMHRICIAWHDTARNDNTWRTCHVYMICIYIIYIYIS